MVMLSCTLKSYGSQLGPMVCMAAPAEGGACIPGSLSSNFPGMHVVNVLYVHCKE